MTLSEARRWRKSSYTGNDNCVEVVNTLDRVRDSKQRSGPELLIAAPRLRSFLSAVREGHFEGRPKIEGRAHYW